jgi:hypothetical protein
MLVDLLIALACISAGLSFLILIDQYRKEAKDNGAWGVFGDVVELPDAARKPGGARLHRGSAGPVRTGHSHHDGTGQ